MCAPDLSEAAGGPGAGVGGGFGRASRAFSNQESMVAIGWVPIIGAFLTLTAGSCPDRLSWSGQTVERRTRRSPLVFHGLAVEDYPTADPLKPPSRGYPYTSQFWLISIYKGAKKLAKIWGIQRPTHGVYDIRDRYGIPYSTIQVNACKK